MFEKWDNVMCMINILDNVILNEFECWVCLKKFKKI